jgi:hypothetical protein
MNESLVPVFAYLDRVQDDVAVAFVELTIFVLWPGDDLEVFNTPYKQACFRAYRAVVPRRLSSSRIVPDSCLRFSTASSQCIAL